VRYNVNPELGTRSEYKWVEVEEEVDVGYEHPGKHTLDLDGIMHRDLGALSSAFTCRQGIRGARTSQRAHSQLSRSSTSTGERREGEPTMQSLQCGGV